MVGELTSVMSAGVVAFGSKSYASKTGSLASGLVLLKSRAWLGGRMRV